MPVDVGRFAIACAVVAVAVFAVLELLVQPTPMITSLVSLIAGMLMAYGINMSTRREYERHTHVNDKGWIGEEVALTPKEEKRREKAKQRAKRAAKRKKNSVGAVLLLVLVTVYFVAIVGFGLLSMFEKIVLVRLAVCAVVAGYVIYVARDVFALNKVVQQRDPLIAAVALLVAVALNIVIVCISPVNDVWYYLGDAVCIAGLVVSAVGMIRTFNTSTTRPLPKLFDREGV